MLRRRETRLRAPGQEPAQAKPRLTCEKISHDLLMSAPHRILGSQRSRLRQALDVRRGHLGDTRFWALKDVAFSNDAGESLA
jgi:hypothetical protein